MAKQVKDEPKKTRKPKAKSRPLGPDELHELAKMVREIADEIDLYANNQRRLKLGPIKALTGNFFNACSTIRDFNSVQILARLIPLATKAGVSVQALLRPIDDVKNS